MKINNKVIYFVRNFYYFLFIKKVQLLDDLVHYY